jgi:hypothetical protein
LTAVAKILTVEGEKTSKESSYPGVWKRFWIKTTYGYLR